MMRKKKKKNIRMTVITVSVTKIMLEEEEEEEVTNKGRGKKKISAGKAPDRIFFIVRNLTVVPCYVHLLMSCRCVHGFM